MCFENRVLFNSHRVTFFSVRFLSVTSINCYRRNVHSNRSLPKIIRAPAGWCQFRYEKWNWLSCHTGNWKASLLSKAKMCTHRTMESWATWLGFIIKLGEVMQTQVQERRRLSAVNELLKRESCTPSFCHLCSIQGRWSNVSRALSHVWCYESVAWEILTTPVLYH